MSWTPGKKVGDEVAIHEGGWHGKTVICRIKRETATMFILDDPFATRIRKSDGKKIGAGYYDRAEDATDAVKAEVAERLRMEKINSESRRIVDELAKLHRYQDGREWIVKNIGPLLKKKEEAGS